MSNQTHTNQPFTHRDKRNDVAYIGWIFTLNNPEGQLNPSTMPNVRFMTWQEERAPTTGTHHYQGYLELKKRQKHGGVCAIIPRAWFEPRKGTRKQAIAYVTKEDTRIRGPWEYGASFGQGHRSDLNEAYTMIQAGASERQLMDHDFGMWARNYQAFIRAKRLLLPQRNFKTKVIVLYGETGSGKSRWCQETFPNAFWKPRGQWWCGYEQQEAVIIDDFYGWIPYDSMLRLLDRYPLLVETKGGQEVFNSKTIILTSNIPPHQWYDYNKHVHMSFSTVDRRLDVIVEFKKVTIYVDDPRWPGRGVYIGENSFEKIVHRGDWQENASLDQSESTVDLSL
jgi:Putative viral replication protein/RNA helicase